LKTYTILIKDPNVQRWFNTLFDEANLSNTVEILAKKHINPSKIHYDTEAIDDTINRYNPSTISTIKQWFKK